MAKITQIDSSCLEGNLDDIFLRHMVHYYAPPLLGRDIKR